MPEKTHIGKVSFFDYKKGWGFINIIDPDSDLIHKDVFFHFSAIRCDNNIKKLFPGEIVSLKIKEDGERLTAEQVFGLFDSKLFIDSSDHEYKIIKKKPNHSL